MKAIANLSKILGENGKQASQKWNGLDGKAKGILGALVAVDTAMKGLALATLAKTPRGKVRGPKLLWSMVIPALNTFGWAAFYLFGRKR